MRKLVAVLFALLLIGPPIAVDLGGGGYVPGTVKVGAKVAVRPGTWKAGSASVASFAYQWLRNGVAIPRATASTYR